jgi:daunorubicin resistance ABC transporter ATP-binding subunit
METIVEANGLTKRYRRTTALAGLDLVAYHGRMAAVLGPNGAGKTTFMRTLATLVRPDSGSLRAAGIDVVRQPAQVRRVIGLAGQYAAVEEAMTGRENLLMVGHLFGLRRRAARAAAARVLGQLGLSDDADRLVRTYSGGMRRKLDLGASLVGSPRLLLLDEPTTGLDPRSRIELWEAIRVLVAAGTDVVLTTQYLDEADHLAADIVIIDHGKAIAAGTPSELKARAGHDVIEAHPRDPGDLGAIAQALTRFDPRPRVDAAAGRVAIAVDAGTARLVDAARLLDELGLEVEDLALRRPTLDEVFLNLTGQAAGTTEAPPAVTAGPDQEGRVQ